PLKKEDVGGKVGRSVTFHPASGGRITIRRADGTHGEL
ncbi:MAG: chemotaxis protein CheD, partial [Methanoregula sp.]